MQWPPRIWWPHIKVIKTAHACVCVCVCVCDKKYLFDIYRKLPVQSCYVIESTRSIYMSNFWGGCAVCIDLFPSAWRVGRI